MEITFRVKPHLQPYDVTIDVEDLGISQEEWQQKDNESKDRILTEYIEGLPEQPFFVLDKIYPND